MLQRILHTAIAGVLQPAFETAAAGHIPIITMNDNQILLFFSQGKCHLFPKVMDDHFHTRLLLFEKKYALSEIYSSDFYYIVRNMQ